MSCVGLMFFLVAHVQVQHRKSFAWSDNYIWEYMYRKKFQDQGKKKKLLQVIYRNNHKLEIVWSHSFLWAQNNNCTLELGQLNVTLCPRVSLLMRIFLSQAFTLTHRLTLVTHAVYFWYVNFLTLPDIRKATCNFFYSQSFDKRIVREWERKFQTKYRKSCLWLNFVNFK